MALPRRGRRAAGQGRGVRRFRGQTSHFVEVPGTEARPGVWAGLGDIVGATRRKTGGRTASMDASETLALETAAQETATLERATLRKVYLRLVPFCFLLYILCYVDRINVSFAALTMNRDLGLSASVYGLAAGAFFWGYCLLEVPSNIILEKVGARRWIARIMISWGLLSAATAAVTGPNSFFAVRVLVGIAEAGLFPGLLLYFHRWFPQHHRGRVVGWFLTRLPLATAIGAPLSTALLQMDGVMGLHGWQWMFIGEGLPTAVIGVTVLFWLTERPSEAKWLAPEQRAWLEGVLHQETARSSRCAPLAFCRR